MLERYTLIDDSVLAQETELVKTIEDLRSEEDVIPAIDRARSVIELCADLDNSVMTGQKLELDDPRIAELKSTLLNHAGSEGLTQYFQDYNFSRHAESGSPIPFSSIPSLHGIDLDAEDAGMFNTQGAKRFEVRELAVLIPSSIDGAIRRGEIGEAERNRAKGRKWMGKFEEHFGQPFTHPDNLGLIYRNPDTQEQWKNHNPYSK